MSWKKLLSYFLPSFGILVYPPLAFAQSTSPLPTQIEINVSPPNIPGLSIITITSGGDKAGIDAARNQIQAALLGLFIVFAAWAIMLIIQTFFGVTILGDIQIPTPFQFQQPTQ
ncbi:hypothetical protein HYW54_02530 [Candidatus Gottesmanbacteria bacterium]|nr:hypothetical protein [Candidatus Gottesmanbacteria bacterium]